MLFRNLHKDFQFIFINTAEGKDYYRKEIEALGGKVYDVVVPGKGLLRSLRQAKIIRKILQKEKPIAVHSHYFSNNGIYLAQAYRENVPIRIAHCHQYSSDYLSIGKKIAVIFSRILTKMFATHKYACCENGRRFMYGNTGEVFFYSIDYNRFKPIKRDLFAKYHLEKSNRYFVFVGRYVRQKNIPFLLNICKSLTICKNIKFIFVGHGPEEQMVLEFIKQNHLDNIVLFPPDTNIPEILSISTALLLPSLYEGLPITLIESQAVGIPALVSENISHEMQLGLLKFLPLCLETWTHEIKELSEKEQIISPLRSAYFDQYYSANFFDGIYSNIDTDEWILRGKEYSIGSKRFYRSKELSTACFKEAHRLGNIRGTFYYALALFEGNGVPKDKNKAASIVKNIVKAVKREYEKHNDKYAVILADMYSFGLGKKQSFEKAFEIYLEAANMGNLEAMCDLGYMYLVGQGVNVDKSQSTYWYKKSADLGYVHSMRDVGQNYLHGHGAEKDETAAVKYFKMGSQCNYSHATSDLAYCYLNGIGVYADENQAKELFFKALQQDPERTTRDLIRDGIDVKTLIQDGKIIFLDNEEIDDISEQNSYAGILFINKRIKNVNAKCFYSSNIKKIFVEKDNEFYTAKDGVLFNADKTTIVRYPLKNPEETYTIPLGVEIVGPHAFQNSKNLKHIVLPEGIKVIDNSAFDDCKNLETIILPSTLEYIGPWAFHGCDKLCSIVIPAGVNNIGTYAFGSCEKLAEITVSKDNVSYCSINGNLYSHDKSVFLQYAIAKKEKNFIMPKTVNTIAFRAFSDSYYLECVDLQNVGVVETKAFYFAKSLKKVICKKGIVIKDQVFDCVDENFAIEEIE